MRATARPRCGRLPWPQVIAVAPVRIGHDRLAPDFVEGDVLRRMPRRRRDRHRREDAVGIAGRPLQHLHPAHRSADDRSTASRCRDASISSFCARTMSAMVMTGKSQAHKACRSPELVSPGRSSPCSRRSRWRRSRSSGRYRSACPGRPACSHQPGLPVIGCGSATILVAGQRVADQDGVGLVGVQLAVGL